MFCKVNIMELSMVCKFAIMELSMFWKFNIMEHSMVEKLPLPKHLELTCGFDLKVSSKMNKRTAVVWSKPKDSINTRLFFFSNLNLPICLLNRRTKISKEQTLLSGKTTQ